jgi:hypothetical protein
MILDGGNVSGFPGIHIPLMHFSTLFSCHNNAQNPSHSQVNPFSVKPYDVAPLQSSIIARKYILGTPSLCSSTIS